MICAAHWLYQGSFMALALPPWTNDASTGNGIAILLALRPSSQPEKQTTKSLHSAQRNLQIYDSAHSQIVSFPCQLFFPLKNHGFKLENSQKLSSILLKKSWHHPRPSGCPRWWVPSSPWAVAWPVVAIDYTATCQDPGRRIPAGLSWNGKYRGSGKKI